MTSSANAPVAMLPTAPPIPAASSLLMPSPSSGAIVMMKTPSAPQIVFDCHHGLGLFGTARLTLLLGLLGRSPVARLGGSPVDTLVELAALFGCNAGEAGPAAGRRKPRSAHRR